MDDRKYVIALGFFDGIHIGHSALLERVLQLADEKNLIPSVLTFDTHPLSHVTGTAIPLINSPADRKGLINRIFGIDDVIFLHFDANMMHMSWSDFVERIATDFNVAHFVAGYDFRFGYKGEGNYERLLEKCENMGVGCDIVPDVVYKDVKSSSTHIRELIAEGDIVQANEFLGHFHVLTDTVRYGYRLGRTLGAPTVNMRFPEGIVTPAFGVYATKVCLEDGGEYIGVTNVGVKPTVSGSDEVPVETYILDFAGNLYGKPVRIEFCKHLRSEVRFSSTDVLKAQIQYDAQAVRDLFAGLTR